MISSTFASAQNQKTYKSKILYNELVEETQDYKLYVVDVVSTADYTKLKLRIQNLTDDFLVYDPALTTFIINGEKVPTSEKRVVDIQPQSISSIVLDVKNTKGIASSLKLDIDGISKVSRQAKVMNAPSFDIPASVNEFKVEGFEVLYMPKESEVKDELTELRFKFTYKGDKIGILQGSKATLNVNGRDYAILNTGLKTYLLMSGESKILTFKWSFGKGSMNLANSKLAVTWNNTFMEDKPQSLKGKEVELTINPEKSK